MTILTPLKMNAEALIGVGMNRECLNNFSEKTQTKSYEIMKKKSDILYLGISDEAKKIFDAVAEKYSEKIDITLDFAVLAIFSESCARLKRYFAMTNGKSPMAENGKNMLNPILNAISMQEKQIHQCAAKLGLTPDARNKIKLDLAEIVKSETGTGRRKQKRAQTAEEKAEEFC